GEVQDGGDGTEKLVVCARLGAGGRSFSPGERRSRGLRACGDLSAFYRDLDRDDNRGASWRILSFIRAGAGRRGAARSPFLDPARLRARFVLSEQARQ